MNSTQKKNIVVVLLFALVMSFIPNIILADTYTNVDQTIEIDKLPYTMMKTNSFDLQLLDIPLTVGVLKEPYKYDAKESIPELISEPIFIQECEYVCENEEYGIYNTYDDEELDLLFRVVEAEAGIGDVEDKSHVASVIFNRVEAGIEDGDLIDILTAKSQFSVISDGSYLRVTVTDDTIQACEIAFEEDTAQGALFFDRTNGRSWAASHRRFLFRDSIGHDFYK